MKRIVCVILSTVIVLSLCGCNRSLRDDYLSLQAEYNELQSKYNKLINDQISQEIDEILSEEASTADSIQNEPFFTCTGVGDDVVAGLKTEGWSMLKATHTGSGYFSIKAHYGTGQYDYDLLVSTTGSYYGGTTLLHPDTEYTLEINSERDWNIEVFELEMSSTDSFGGNGDTVTPFFVPSANAYKIVAKGSGHLSIKGYCYDGDYDLLVNQSEDYSGTVYFGQRKEYSFFVIKGDYEFKIIPR